MLKLYGFPPSPNDRKVRFVLKHLGIEFEDHVVDLSTGAHKKPEYLAINPFGRIPAIVDGDFRLSESNAIMQYVADKKPGSLFPKEPRARIDVTRWQFWSTGQWGPACGALIFERVVKAFMGLGAPDAAAIAKGEEAFHREAAVLDNHLAGRDWVVGNAITVADVSLGVWLGYRAPAQLPLDKYKNVQRWIAKIEALPAWKQTLPPGMGWGGVHRERIEARRRAPPGLVALVRSILRPRGATAVSCGRLRSPRGAR